MVSTQRDPVDIGEVLNEVMTEESQLPPLGLAECDRRLNSVQLAMGVLAWLEPFD